MQQRVGLTTLLCLLCMARGVLAADLTPAISLIGFVEGRFVLSDGPRSWEDAGLGKISFGGDVGDRAVAHPEAAAVLVADMGWNAKLVASASLDPRRDGNPLDLVEAFVTYESGPAQRNRFHLKAGAFFPPVSFENTNLAWTSPYSLTSSAINTWIGEELRTFGVEAAFTHRFAAGQIGLRGAVFGANDPAGVLLAWRGWAVSDRESGIFERLPLAPLEIYSATGPVPQQAPWFEPRHEIDHRPGVYAGLDLELHDFGAARLLIYDNLARDTGFDGFQYAWRTRFASLGARIFAGAATDVVVQGLIGDTRMGTEVPGMSLVAADFASAFVLVSRDWDRHRLSARAEYFETTDRDLTALDNNSEHGTALTAAYVFRPLERHRLTLELLHLISYRPERAVLGLPLKARETQAQVSYRIFF